MQLPQLDFIRLSTNAPEGSIYPTTGNYANQRQPWLRFGDDNLYPQHLIRYRTYSPTHFAILKLKAELLFGEGFLNLPEDQHLLDTQLLSRLSLDYILHGGFALEVVWSRDGKQIAQINPIPFAQIRLAAPNPDGQIEGVYLSKDWNAYEKERNLGYKPIFIPKFAPEKAKESSRQVWYYADYCPEWAHYPMASYQAALPDVIWDYEYSRFKTANMQNGMFPALHITVEGEPTEEERQYFYQELKRKFSGSKQAGEVLITYGEEGSGKVAIKPIEIRGNADLFKTWSEDAIQRIISGHRLSSPVLAGLPGNGSLGGQGNEISVAFEYFFNTSIRPLQLTVIGQLKQLLAFTTKDYQKLEIANSKPIRLTFGEDLLQKLLTINEMRAELGYEMLRSGMNSVIDLQQTVAQSLLPDGQKTEQSHETVLDFKSSSKSTLAGSGLNPSSLRPHK